MKHIGIDIGKKKCDVCVMDDAGRVVETGQYPNTVKDAARTARDIVRKYGRCRAACETTGNMWRKTYDTFEAAGIPIKLANTFHMAIIAKTAKKTDKVDAKKIAHVLRMNMIPECYVPESRIRGIRAMVRQRIRMTQDRTRIINRMHSMLDRYDVAIDATHMYAEKALAQLDAITLDSPHDALVLEQYVRQIRHLTEEIDDMDALLEKEAAYDENAKLLASMTGMGTYSALALSAEIGDISRFADPKKMVSWAGLCPTIHQSGDQLYLGKRKKLDTNGLVNWIMCEAANVAARHDPRMRSIYESAKKRHAGKHALGIIVVANKMLTIAWHMLTTQTPYTSHNQRLYKRKLAKIEKATRR